MFKGMIFVKITSNKQGTMKSLLLFSVIAAFFPLIAMSQSTDVSTLPPIDELGKDSYKGHQGGLYPNGSNEMPKPFFNDAVEMAKSVQPLDSKGNPDPNGKIGLIALGASTATMFSRGLEVKIPEEIGINREIVFVDCAIGGQDLSKIMIPTASFWKTIDDRLSAASITRDQVQVMFFQEDNLKNKSADINSRGEDLVSDFTYIANFVKQHYPNLKIMYITGRHTTMWIPDDAGDKHREPRAYINGWACKWLIEKQINGDPDLAYRGDNAKAPLIMWGPYFWTQGTKPRSDGYYWGPELLSRDGVHPNDAGIERVTMDLIQFWKNDPVSQYWFFENPQVSAHEKYMQFMINQSLADKILYSELHDHIRITVLKDSIKVFEQDYEQKQDAFEITLPDAGNYKYLITDRETKVFAGKFSVDENGNIVVMQRAYADITNDSLAGYTLLDNVANPNSPAWLVNGKDKLPKLRKLVAGHDPVKAVFKSSAGTEVLTIEDIIHKHSDLNKLLDRGEYVVTFYDENGKEIDIDIEQQANLVRIKY